MVCPEYEEDAKCGFHDRSYVLTQQHISNFCVFPGNEYLTCEEFVQFSRRQPRGLETTATKDDISP